jgi:hypothetical protein
MIRNLLATLALVLAPLGATAQPQVQVRPIPGALYAPAESGSGWLFEVWPGGLAFAAHYTYDPAGDTGWLILQGNFVPNDENDRLRTGILGRVSSTLFVGTNGPCFGCPYTAPAIGPSSFGTGELVFFGTRRAEFRWNGQTKQLSRLAELDPAATPDAVFKGTWRVSLILRNLQTGQYSESDEGYVTFRNRTAPRIYFRPATSPQGLPADPLIPLPGDDWPQYEMVCPPFNCPALGSDGSDGAGISRNPVWYRDPNTGDIHGLEYCDATGIPNPTCGVQDGGVLRAGYYGGRYDFLIVTRDFAVVRLGSGYSTQMVYGGEYVLRRVLDGIAPVPLSTP